MDYLEFYLILGARDFLQSHALRDISQYPVMIDNFELIQCHNQLLLSHPEASVSTSMPNTWAFCLTKTIVVLIKKLRDEIGIDNRRHAPAS